MLFQMTNRTRSNLTGAEYGELAALAKKFYASIPVDVEIRGEWAAADPSHDFLRCAILREFRATSRGAVSKRPALKWQETCAS
jgi:hypothetical protein